MGRQRKEHQILEGIEHKHCYNCGIWRELGEFGENKRGLDGLQCSCNSCRKQYRQDNKEAIAAKKKQWCQDNKEDIAVKRKQRYQDNKESIAVYSKQYRRDNKEAIIAYNKQYRQNNKEAIAIHFKRYQQDNKEIMRSYVRKRRAMRRQVEENYTPKDAELIEFMFDYECFNCGSEKNLAHDHFRPLSKGYALTPNNAVLLCNSCNSKKHTKDPEDFFTPEQMSKLNFMHEGLDQQESNCGV